MKPLLKWPGGKHRLAPMISEAFGGKCKGYYYEPFAGSLSVYLHRWSQGEVDSKKSVLSDINLNLINLYTLIRDRPQTLIKKLRTLPTENTLENYTDLRKIYNAPSLSRTEVSALLLWLNKACYNGLYRENSKGYFNVPKGSYKTVVLPTDEHIMEVSKALQGAELIALPYCFLMTKSGPDDQIYCDPPYFPASVSSNFCQYSKDGFDDIEQAILAREAIDAAKRGSVVVISNADTEASNQLYRPEDGFSIHKRIQVQRSISAKTRYKTGELIAKIGG